MKDMSIMCVPSGFKIRKKTDIDIFVDKCMQKNDEYYLKVKKDLAVYFTKDKDGFVYISEKHGDLYDIFNPLLEVASTKHDCYRQSVSDCVWKYRKYINLKWFNN